MFGIDFQRANNGVGLWLSVALAALSFALISLIILDFL